LRRSGWKKVASGVIGNREWGIKDKAGGKKGIQESEDRRGRSQGSKDRN
jgi:hypothetical protein